MFLTLLNVLFLALQNSLFRLGPNHHQGCRHVTDSRLGPLPISDNHKDKLTAGQRKDAIDINGQILFQ